ncbi:hypothetical protein KCU83_g225, partial [Aureobasidium melanogenum]
MVLLVGFFVSNRPFDIAQKTIYEIQDEPIVQRQNVARTAGWDAAWFDDGTAARRIFPGAASHRQLKREGSKMEEEKTLLGTEGLLPTYLSEALSLALPSPQLLGGHLSLTKDRPPRTSSKTFVCLPCACATRSSTSKHSLEAAAAAAASKAFFVSSPSPASHPLHPPSSSPKTCIFSLACDCPAPKPRLLFSFCEYLIPVRLAAGLISIGHQHQTSISSRVSGIVLLRGDPSTHASAFVVASNNIAKPSRTPTSHLLGCSFPEPPQPASVPNAPFDPAE